MEKYKAWWEILKLLLFFNNIQCNKIIDNNNIITTNTTLI